MLEKLLFLHFFLEDSVVLIIEFSLNAFVHKFSTIGRLLSRMTEVDFLSIFVILLSLWVVALILDLQIIAGGSIPKIFFLDIVDE